MKKIVVVLTIMILICISPVEFSTFSIKNILPAQAKVMAGTALSAAKNDAPEKPASEGKSTTEYNIIGYSYEGNVIYDVVITPANYDRTMLITFAIHGFEGSWYDDGTMLVQIGNDLVREFSSHPEELKTTRLIVVPCVNPDGTRYGQTEDGVGRCNGQGIDINRDFDFHWKFGNKSEYRTGKTPFSTPEAQILRNLVQNQKPDIVVDFHGWENRTYGDDELGKYFDEALKLSCQGPQPKDKAYLGSTFIGWASEYARAVLVEYPNPVNPQNVNEWGYSQNTIKAITAICNSN